MTTRANFMMINTNGTYSDNQLDGSMGDFNLWIYFGCIVTSSLYSIHIWRKTPSQQQVQSYDAGEHDEA